jgi:hypothetical protein
MVANRALEPDWTAERSLVSVGAPQLRGARTANRAGEGGGIECSTART